MKRYEIPAPPADGIVEDENGNRYHSHECDGEYWTNEDVPAVRGTYVWHDLLDQRGPVTEVAE